MGQWVASCRDCGTRKFKSDAVVPPLRPIKVGEVGDRWALDLQGPFARPSKKVPKGTALALSSLAKDQASIEPGKYIYVAAFTEYVTVPLRFRTAIEIARAFLDHVVFVFGPCRELMLDSASEFRSELFEQICTAMQVNLTHSVPYQPAMMGLVKRFNCTFKDMLAMYVNDAHDD